MKDKEIEENYIHMRLVLNDCVVEKLIPLALVLTSNVDEVARFATQTWTELRENNEFAASRELRH
ncbi:hypothetical protein GW776_05370 [archaeon]|nr:hypothetical protein [archaeon]PJB16993.1 MAG: hypothetical protein CO117_13275 [Flavobacteriaceae bacterium CG_4_9_14_3_um_filter_33_16]